MSDSINTINVGGIDKEVEDTVARNSGTNANSRCTTLESSVSNLATRVEEIIAPTGEAPNPAEIVDARIGHDNTIYQSLGAAVRGQVDDIYSVIESDCLDRGPSIYYPSSNVPAPYDDLDTVPYNKIIMYQSYTEQKVSHLPNPNNIIPFNLVTLQGYRNNSLHTGITQVAFYTDGSVFSRTNYGADEKWSEWREMDFATRRTVVHFNGDSALYSSLNDVPKNCIISYSLQNTSDYDNMTYIPNGLNESFVLIGKKGYANTSYPDKGAVQFIITESGRMFVRENSVATGLWTGWMELGYLRKVITLSSASDTLANLNTVPIPSVLCYALGSGYAYNAPIEGSNDGFTLITETGYGINNETGACQKLIYSNGDIYTRNAWYSPAQWTPWKKVSLSGDSIQRDRTAITGTLPNDSPYLDLNTFPTNSYACYNSPTNEILNMPEDVSSKVFNILSFRAYDNNSIDTAHTQLLFTPNGGHVYSRTSWGANNDFSSWRRLDSDVDPVPESTSKWSYHNLIWEKIELESTTDIIFSGDSITQGVTSYYDEGIKNKNSKGYVGYFRDLTGCNVTNAGVARSCYTKDNTSTSIIDKLKTISLDCDYLFIAGGTNDWGVTQCSAADFKAALEDTYDYVDANCTGKVIIMLPINRLSTTRNSANLFVSDYREMLYEEALRRGYSVIDCDDFFPNVRGSWQEEVLLDTVHPTELGHELYAKSILTQLI